MRRAWWPVLMLAGLVTPADLARAADTPHRPTVLQVPYLAQSWLLCGGAAIAMVERWWGRRGVFAEEFSHLVRPELGGIRTTDLVAATRARGWDADPFVGTAARVHAALRDSMPVVALIEVSPDRFHFVVILGWANDTVVLHDPAVGPFQERPASTFLAQWRAADHWALLVTPVPDPTPIPRAGRQSPPPPTPAPCAPWLDQAIDAARRDELAEAVRQLELARAACPGEPLVEREAAGIAFRRGEYARATAKGLAYLDRAPGDTLAWQLVATAQYLVGDRHGALDSWNRIGVPVHDLLRIDGISRVRFHAVARTIDLPLGHPLTSRGLALARRRLGDLPGVAASRIVYEPVAGGRVEVHAAIVERPVLPSLPRLVLGNVARALAADETELDLANLTRGGERMSVEWRWRRSNPGVALRLEAPVHVGMPFVVGLTTRWERFRFDDGTEGARRRSHGLEMRGWAAPGIEFLGALHLERWGAQRFVGVTGGGGLHDRSDRVALTGAFQHAIPRGGGDPYQRVQGGIGWRSTTARLMPAATARLGVEHVSRTAPRGAWPVAGGGISQAIPLRSQPFLVTDLLPSARVSRTIVHGGITFDHPVGRVGPVEVALGAFVDAATIARATPGPGAARFHLDTGIGIQVEMPGASGMRFRMDLARALDPEPRWGVSAGLVRPWPPRTRTFR